MKLKERNLAVHTRTCPQLDTAANGSETRLHRGLSSFLLLLRSRPIPAAVHSYLIMKIVWPDVVFARINIRAPFSRLGAGKSGKRTPICFPFCSWENLFPWIRGCKYEEISFSRVKRIRDAFVPIWIRANVVRAWVFVSHCFFLFYYLFSRLPSLHLESCSTINGA